MTTRQSDDEVRLGPLEALTGYHLRRAWAIVSADFSRAMEGTGMRQVLFGILAVIAANPGINQGAIGRALGIQRANMVGLITEILESGLVVRNVSSDDRRAFTFALTAKGRRTFDDALARIVEHERVLLQSLSTAERETLISLLAKVEAGAA